MAQKTWTSPLLDTLQVYNNHEQRRKSTATEPAIGTAYELQGLSNLNQLSVQRHHNLNSKP